MDEYSGDKCSYHKSRYRSILYLCEVFAEHWVPIRVGVWLAGGIRDKIRWEGRASSRRAASERHGEGQLVDPPSGPVPGSRSSQLHPSSILLSCFTVP